jgi:hypothetical protein
MAIEEREKAALTLLEKETRIDKLKKPELELLLSWHGIAKSHQPKGNDAKMEKWREIINSKKAAPRYHKWTDEDEGKLKHLEESKIDISETARGRADCTIKREMLATFNKMTKNDQKDHIDQLQKHVEDV